jgi:hypothetical protein
MKDAYRFVLLFVIYMLPVFIAVGYMILIEVPAYIWMDSLGAHSTTNATLWQQQTKNLPLGDYDFVPSGALMYLGGIWAAWVFIVTIFFADKILGVPEGNSRTDTRTP